MRTILSFSIVLLATFTSCSQDLKKLSSNEIDQKKLAKAKTFATDYLTQLNNGGTLTITDNATSAIKDLLTPVMQQNLNKQIKDGFGKFTSLNYEETWIQNGNTKMPIHRFKGEFEKDNKVLEVRVVLDEEGKVAGFWLKPWSDVLQ